MGRKEDLNREADAFLKACCSFQSHILITDETFVWLKKRNINSFPCISVWLTNVTLFSLIEENVHCIQEQRVPWDESQESRYFRLYSSASTCSWHRLLSNDLCLCAIGSLNLLSQLSAEIMLIKQIEIITLT